MPDITVPLDIPDIEIVNSEFKDNRFILQVKSTVEGTTCYRCKKWITKRHAYAEAISLRHLPILDREVIIRIRPVRYECPECDDHPTTTQQLDWYNKKSSCTKAYEKCCNSIILIMVLFYLNFTVNFHHLFRPENRSCRSYFVHIP